MFISPQLTTSLSPQDAMGGGGTGACLQLGYQLRTKVCTRQHPSSSPQADLCCPLLDVHFPLHGSWISPLPSLPFFLHTVLVRRIFYLFIFLQMKFLYFLFKFLFYICMNFCIIWPYIATIWPLSCLVASLTFNHFLYSFFYICIVFLVNSFLHI